jgi:hypothetical protein
MSLLPSIIFSVCLLSASFFAIPSAHAVSAKDIAAALDAPADSGIEFSDSTAGWAKKTGSVAITTPSGVPSVSNTYLVGTSPGKANPQKAITFSLKVRGAGTLSFRYQVSLDDWNDAELCAYEDNYDDGYLWGDSGYWDENVETGWDWWEEEEFDLGTDSYTHTVTFAILGPTSEGYEKPELNKEWGEILYNKAWLDNFAWEPNPFYQILEFSPDPETDNSFEDRLRVSLNSAYDNISFRYTTNGSTPTMNSPLYIPGESAEIEISQKTTIKAIAIENNQRINDTIYEATYLPRTKAPELTLEQGDFASSATVTFSSETPNAQFYYTTNGQPPIRTPNGNPGESTSKGTKATLTDTTTIQVMAWAESMPDSIVIAKRFEKLPKPQIDYSLDNNSTHPCFDNQGTLTLTATQGARIRYQITGGNVQVYENPLDITETTEIRFQAQQEGKLHSDTVTRKFYRADTLFPLDPPEAPGWSLFFLPGEVSEKTSAKLIADWQPIAHDSQKKIYYRPDLLRGGNSYWVFTPEGNTRAEPIEHIYIYPLEGITIPANTWMLSGIPEGASIPQDIQAHTWNGQNFQPASPSHTGPAWFYTP